MANASLYLSVSLRVIVLTVLKPPCRRDLIEKEKSNLGNPAVPVPSLFFFYTEKEVLKIIITSLIQIQTLYTSIPRNDCFKSLVYIYIYTVDTDMCHCRYRLKPVFWVLSRPDASHVNEGWEVTPDTTVWLQLHERSQARIAQLGNSNSLPVDTVGDNMLF